MVAENVLREELVFLLRRGNAHMSLDEAVQDFPEGQMNARAPHVEYTPWHILEHIRRTQRDIIEFIQNPDYQELSWPKDYWPAVDEKADVVAWEETLRGFHADLEILIAMAEDPKTDLYTPLAHGTGQNILRELQVVADHNSYHIGEFAILRQVMQTWTR